MDKAFELNGFWWLPETPGEKVPGKVIYTPGESIVLELMGDLDTQQYRVYPPPGPFNPPIIQGISSSQGNLITLFNCLRTHGAGLTDALITAQFAFIGVHFSTVDEIRFKALSVHFHELDEWFSRRFFQIESHEDGSGKITFSRFQPIATMVGDYHIDFVIRGPKPTFDRFKHIEINQQARINIWTEVEKPILDFLPIVRHIQNFVSLASSYPTFVTSVMGNSEAARQEDTNRISYHPIEVYYPATGWQQNISKTHFFQMLFTLPKVEDRLETVLKNWIEKANVIQPVYDLYFLALYNPYTYPEFEFLSLTQAIETYHRRIYGGKYQSDEEFWKGLYKILVSAIPDEINDDFRSSLKTGKLKYANEYSLSKRLQLLCRHLADKTNIPFLSDKKQRDIFVDKVKNTRNYFTHFTPELRELAALGGKELYLLKEKLRLILQICFLEELGFSFEKIIEMFKENREYREYFKEER